MKTIKKKYYLPNLTENIGIVMWPTKKLVYRLLTKKNAYDNNIEEKFIQQDQKHIFIVFTRMKFVKLLQKENIKVKTYENTLNTTNRWYW